MKRPVALLIVGLCLVLLAYAAVQSFTPPRLEIRVVDTSGQPVPGATIQPDGIRGTDGGHYGWTRTMPVQPDPVVTDSNGRASIVYPKFIHERVRSIELSFGVSHPDFGSERPFISVSAPLTSATPWKTRALYLWEDFRRRGRVEAVVLKRAGIVVVRARLGDSIVAGTNLHVMLESQEGLFNGRFQAEGSQLVSKQVPPGLFLVRSVYLAPGTNYFSAVESGIAEAHRTNFFDLELAPGRSVTGKLSGVEGPIVNGWVNARVLSSKPNQPNIREELLWADFANVGADGTFVLAGLPPGRLECVALCDGHLSDRPPGAAAGYDVLPVTLEVPSSDELVLEMIPAATARIQVLDPDGKPLPRASVHFWPNIQWAQRWSTIFASDFYRSADALQALNGRASRASKREFTVRTGSDGVAWIRELPPSQRGQSRFAVSHDLYDLPLNSEGDRQDQIVLQPGRTNYAGVKLQKKGGRQRE